MEILKGLLYINNVDVYETYGAFLTEEKQGDTSNYDALMKPSEVKEQEEISFKEKDGVELPAKIIQSLKARDVALKFAISADDKVSFLTRYQAFLKMLRTGVNGWLDFYLPELDMHFAFYYKSAEKYKQLTDFEGQVMGRFSVVFREPKPQF